MLLSHEALNLRSCRSITSCNQRYNSPTVATNLLLLLMICLKRVLG